MKAVSNKRFKFLCHIWGRQAIGTHSQESRWIRDLDFGPERVWIRLQSRKIICSHRRKTRLEELDLFHPYAGVTKRLEAYIFDLCKIITVREVAGHLDLDWKTVKAIDSRFLEREYGQTDYLGLRIRPSTRSRSAKAIAI